MDYWRRKYLLPALRSRKRVALIGIGDNPDYWSDRPLSDLAVFWDPARLAVSGTTYCVYDISQRLVERAEAKGIISRCCDVTSAPLDDRYEFIFASDVIEHVSDPLAFIRHCAASLSEKGLLIITTPNALYWRNFFTGFRNEHPEHRCCFGTVHLENLAALAGLTTHECRSFQAVGHLVAVQELLLPLHRAFAMLGRGNSLVACLRK